MTNFQVYSNHEYYVLIPTYITEFNILLTRIQLMHPFDYIGELNVYSIVQLTVILLKLTDRPNLSSQPIKFLFFFYLNRNHAMAIKKYIYFLKE